MHGLAGERALVLERQPVSGGARRQEQLRRGDRRRDHRQEQEHAADRRAVSGDAEHRSAGGERPGERRAQADRQRQQGHRGDASGPAITAEQRPFHGDGQGIGDRAEQRESQTEHSAHGRLGHDGRERAALPGLARLGQPVEHLRARVHSPDRGFVTTCRAYRTAPLAHPSGWRYLPGASAMAIWRCPVGRRVIPCHRITPRGSTTGPRVGRRHSCPGLRYTSSACVPPRVKHPRPDLVRRHSAYTDAAI